MRREMLTCCTSPFLQRLHQPLTAIRVGDRIGGLAGGNAI